MDYENIAWKIIDIYFKDNPNLIVKHHLKSYNDFFDNGIYQIFKENNPITFFKDANKKTNIFKYNFNMYLGGKEGNKIYFGKPVIYDFDDLNERQHIMYPNEARIRNMTYGVSIHYDVDVDFTIYMEDDKPPVEKTITLSQIFLGMFPIMLKSNLCILNKLNGEVCYQMGECRNDPGGYFIVDGKEKVILTQEKFADNTLYIKDKVNELYSHSAEIRSVSEDTSKPTRTLSVRIVAPQPTLENKHIVVNIPNVRKPMPLFIVMRALGVISDKDIVTTCLLDIEENSDMLDLLRPSVHDAGSVFTQEVALKYIATQTKGKTIGHAIDILSNFLFPHIGELNFKQKALYLGYIVKRLLNVFSKKEPPTDRDSYTYKRLETPGILISQLFKEYYNLQLKNIYLVMDKEFFYNKSKYQDMDFFDLIVINEKEIFKSRMVEDGFRKAFKGNWGATEHTKRLGALQDLTRLSYFATLSQLQKTNTPINADGAKIIAPRLLHATQWGNMCPIHTPDGGNVGLHKHLALSCHVTTGCSGYPYIKYMRKLGMVMLEECNHKQLNDYIKIFINGAWVGATSEPRKITRMFKLHRRNGKINSFVSIQWHIARKEINIFTDGGRPCHPVFYMMNNKLSVDRPNVMEKIDSKTLSWNECVKGFNPDNVDPCNINELDIKTLKEDTMMKNAGIVEYIDSQESECILYGKYKKTFKEIYENSGTHYEIHPSIILSFMANQTIYPENNPFPRNAFSCGQSKQAASVFSTNFNNRIDKSSLILNYGQTPLVKSRYFSHITKNEHPYGINAIVAIMCYSGYNVEDAIIVNRAALKRGLFNTTYYNIYESEEEKQENALENIVKFFTSFDNKNIKGMKPGYDYSNLDKETGLIKENTPVDDRTVMIGKVMMDKNKPDTYNDVSVLPKKGQTGFVDKAFITVNGKGNKIAKIRCRGERIPMIGDKFCSRAGQKGTVGIVLDEENMPFTKDGIRPDIIVNPHAMPSRMTIGHLVESQQSKACSMFGYFGDCTAFVNDGSKYKVYGDMLREAGFHGSGNEVMMNGMTGEQLEMSIYFGPTYYLRLKHMVKDKINYRAKGPRTQLTRQTVQGRANNGGLRIGEMDRDVLIAHGMGQFIMDSMMERGDKFLMAVCNKTGCIAVYNESQNLFLSPMMDGPIQYSTNLDNTLNVKNISKHGRDFSLVKVPYCFKLLLQELKTMNIQMRIITDSNIDQIMNLKNNKEIFKLTETEDYDKLMENISEIIKKNTDTFSNTNEKLNRMQFELTPAEKEREQEAEQEIMPQQVNPFGAPPQLGLEEQEAARKKNPMRFNVNQEIVFKNNPNDKFTIVDSFYDDDQDELIYFIKKSDGPDENKYETTGDEIMTPPSSPRSQLSPPFQPESPDYDPDKAPSPPSFEPESPDYDPNKPPSPLMAKDQTTPPGLDMLAPEKEKEQTDSNEGNMDNLNEDGDDDDDGDDGGDSKQITGDIGIIKKVG